MTTNATSPAKPVAWLRLLGQAEFLQNAYREQKECIRTVYDLSASLLRPDPETPAAYTITAGPLPAAQLSLRRNLFSTLFLSVYHILGIERERRLLYGILNQLFRIWVTSADNLLDAEDKVTLPLCMPGESRVMREVVRLMTADRVLFTVLDRAVELGVIDSGAARVLSARTLQVLLPSAAQEATEEAGIRERPPPDEVLQTIHRYKTGLLFHVPFLGPETLETVDSARTQRLKDGLLRFGTGCQVVDDIRDVARDWCENRHNYLLSYLRHTGPDLYEALGRRRFTREDRLYREMPAVAAHAAQLGFDLMRDGLLTLDAEGLGLRAESAAAVASAMFSALDVGDVRNGLQV
jgi:hypothetical protein